MKGATEMICIPLESEDPKLSNDRWTISVDLFVPKISTSKGNDLNLKLDFQTVQK